MEEGTKAHEANGVLGVAQTVGMNLEKILTFIRDMR